MSSAPTAGKPAAGPQGPLTEQELDDLQALLDTLPQTLDPLDVVQIDGYLCAVLLQPEPVAEPLWLPMVVDVDGRAPPAGFDLPRLRALLQRRHDELQRAIVGRQWFDPWIYALDDDASPSETVLPWVAGFATALDRFTSLMDQHEDALLEPLATLYRHLDPDDLEDADALLAEIETLEPPLTLDEAVEDLVRSVLLMADVTLPPSKPAAPPPGPRTTPRTTPRTPSPALAPAPSPTSSRAAPRPAPAPAKRPRPATGAARGAPQPPGRVAGPARKAPSAKKSPRR